jgi:hypothetical protein
MMKFAAVLILSMTPTACSIPDPGDWSDLEAAVGAMPLSQQRTLRRFGANRFGQGLLSNLKSNKRIGSFDCYEDMEDTSKFRVQHITAGQMMACLVRSFTDTWETCAAAIIMSTVDRLKSENLRKGASTTPDCSDADSIAWEDGFDPAEQKLLSEDTQSIGDSLRIILPEPPPLEIQMMFAGAGLFGPAGILCPLAKWGCPDTPNGPPGQNPGESPPGGDYP